MAVGPRVGGRSWCDLDSLLWEKGQDGRTQTGVRELAWVGASLAWKGRVPQTRGELGSVPPGMSLPRCTRAGCRIPRELGLQDSQDCQRRLGALGDPVGMGLGGHPFSVPSCPLVAAALSHQALEVLSGLGLYFGSQTPSSP